LLQRIVEYYNLYFEELEDWNSYYHWQGGDKFNNDDKMNCIRLITLNHKSIGGNIKDIYNLLLKDGSIKPILYP